MLTGRSLSKRFRKNQRRLNNRIIAYLKEQTPEQVHDLRTATRRLSATIELLPKNVRDTKRIRKHSQKIQKLISLNAKARDLDIIISRAIARKSDHEYARLAKKLENARGVALKPAIEFAASMTEAKQPSIRGKTLSNTDTQKRFNKIAKRLNSRITKRLPAVLEDANNKRELHRLREDLRMLRYAIEITGEKKSSKVLPLLRSWQEILGQIHDSDIVIDYLQHEEESPEARDLIRDELIERNKNYEIFASMASKPPATLDQ